MMVTNGINRRVGRDVQLCTSLVAILAQACTTQVKRDFLCQSKMANTLQVHSSDDESSLCPEPLATPSPESPCPSLDARETLAASESIATPSPQSPCPSLETPEFTVGA